MIKSNILTVNKNKLQNMDTPAIPKRIIIGKTPFSFEIQVKYAKNGDTKANIVHPFIKVQP